MPDRKSGNIPGSIESDNESARPNCFKQHFFHEFGSTVNVELLVIIVTDHLRANGSSIVTDDL